MINTGYAAALVVMQDRFDQAHVMWLAKTESNQTKGHKLIMQID